MSRSIANGTDRFRKSDGAIVPVRELDLLEVTVILWICPPVLTNPPSTVT